MDFAEHDTPAETPKDSVLQDALGRLTPRTSMLNALQLIIDAHSLVPVTDRAGRIIYANERLCEVSHYTRDELIGKTRSEIAHNSGPEWEANFKRASHSAASCATRLMITGKRSTG